LPTFVHLKTSDEPFDTNWSRECGKTNEELISDQSET
jgi:hypothetical protein